MFNKQMIFFALLFMIITVTTYPHSGRADGQGGHTNRKTGYANVMTMPPIGKEDKKEERIMGEENPIEEENADPLEMVKIKLEWFKVWGKIITAAITVLFGSVLIAYINYSFQRRQLNQQKLLNETKLKLQAKKEAAELKLQESKAEADQRQAEMKYLGDFIEHALSDDHKRRLRFAEYFAKLTISGELQKKWEEYHNDIRNTIKLKGEKEDLLKKTKDEEEIKKISAEVVQLQDQLDPLPKISEVDLLDEVGLDKDWRPLKYTDNEYELQSEGKVVYDKATGLMWQQSGSDNRISLLEVKSYISALNRENFAGYNNWRLPTLEEAISILEPKNNETDNMFIDPIFDGRQRLIWTSDKFKTNFYWVVNFTNGVCIFSFSFSNFVRAVR